MSKKSMSPFSVTISIFILGILIIFILWATKSPLFIDITRTSTASSLPVISTETATSTATFIPSPTPTLPDEIFKGTISQPTFCHNGPNESYLKAIPLAAGIRVDILAMNSDGGDWFMIRGLGIDPCWVEARMINPEPNVDFQRVMILTTIITTENTPCREFPSPDRAIQTIIPKDRRIVSYGKNDSEAKWILVVPHNSTNLCWIENKYSIDFESLPIESADFALEPTLTATNQPIVPVIPTKTPRSTATKDSRPPANTPVPTNTLGEPSNTPVSTNTPGGPSNTPIPTNTKVPTSTPVPSNTPVPTNTPIPPPTNTPLPTPTPTLCWPPGKCK